MVEMREKLWPSFVSETTDLFDSLGALLAENNHSNVDIDVLFRHFHTLKGSCSALGFDYMAEVAHLSEDILAIYREEKKNLTSEIKLSLLAGIDALKKQFVEASDKGEDSSAPSELIVHLKSMAQTSERLPTQGAGLHNFTQCVQTTLPTLILALNPHAKIERIIPALESLSKEAAISKFLVLSNACQKAKDVLNHEDRAAFMPSLAMIIQHIDHICMAQGVALSLTTATLLARRQLEEVYHSAIDAWIVQFKQIASDEEKRRIETCISAINRLLDLAIIQRYTDHQSVWRYGKQWLLDRARAKAELPFGLRTQFIRLLLHLKANHDGGDVDKALEAFKASVASGQHPVDDIGQLTRDILSQSDLCPAALTGVSLKILHQLVTGIDDGKYALEIEVDFNHEAAAENVLKALQQLTILLYSRTLFHDKKQGVADKTTVCFLLLSPRNPAQLQAQLMPFAQGSACFQVFNARAESQQPSTTDASIMQIAKETTLSLSHLKIPSTAIDEMIHLVAETINTHNRVRYLLNNDNRQSAIIEKNDALKRQLSQLQKMAVGLRVVSVSTVFDRLVMLVDSTAKSLNKRVSIDVQGGDVQIDKTLIDALAEPLAHLVRNSLDHGIEAPDARLAVNKPEKGRVQLSAKETEGMIKITLSDDGKGLDTERIRQKAVSLGLLSADEDNNARIHACIFEPAFSTVDSLSSTSGRGVGMDVVNTKIHALGGQIQLSSHANKGTTIAITVPVSTALQPIVLIKNQSQILAMHERSVQEIVTLDAFDVGYQGNQQVMTLHDQTLPIFYLNQLFNTQKLQSLDIDFFDVVVVSNGEKKIGIVVDQVIGRSEVLVREKHPLIKQMTGISNAAVLGDGNVVFILDTRQLFQASLHENNEKSEGAL